MTVSTGMSRPKQLHILLFDQCGYKRSLFWSSRSSWKVILINASSSSRSVGRVSDMMVISRATPQERQPPSQDDGASIACRGFPTRDRPSPAVPLSPVQS